MDPLMSVGEKTLVGRADSGLPVFELFTQRRQVLELALVIGEPDWDRRLTSHYLHRPGLALAGYTERFSYDRVQVFGTTEMAYLASLTAARVEAAIEQVLAFPIPMIVVTKGQEMPACLVEIAARRQVPLFTTKLTTAAFIERAQTILELAFAPRVTLHGTLMDVYGIGLLFTGVSGIGKSECALDLVERGHRLVADDVVWVLRRSAETVIGMPSPMLQHHMEIRGVGIVDVRRMFGIRAIRRTKRIEAEVRLVPIDQHDNYERLGVEDRFTSLLGVQVPLITIPVAPGKNIPVISEVIAMNIMLKNQGEHIAKDFQEQVMAATTGKVRLPSWGSPRLDLDLE